MKLYTDLDIVNGLSTCRDMFEAKAYLKANNIAISDQELELLQSQCSKINSERTLTIRQLNNVAGGGKSWNGGSPRTKSLDAGRKRSSSLSAISDMPQEFTPEHDQLIHQMKEAVRTFAALSKEAEQAKIQADEDDRKSISLMDQLIVQLPKMQDFVVSGIWKNAVDFMNQLRQENSDLQYETRELRSQKTQFQLRLNSAEKQRDLWRDLYLKLRGQALSGIDEIEDRVSSLSGQEYGKASRRYAPTPVPSSVPDPEPAPRLKPTYSIDPKPIEKSSSFSSRSTPVVKVIASAPTKDGAFSRVFGSPITSSEGSSTSSEAETDSDTSSGSSSPTNSTFAAFDKDASLQGHVPFF